MPASGPVSSRSSPMMRLISVDLPAFGRPTIGDLDRPAGACLLVRRPRPTSRCSRERVVEVGQALAVLGRDRDRLAEAESIGLDRAGVAGRALGLVGDEDDRLAERAQHRGEMPVERRHAGARVDQEQR